MEATAKSHYKNTKPRKREGITEYKHQETITKGRYKMLNLQSIYFGQKHLNFDYKDFDIIKKIQRLARKHQRQATNDCNGEGFVDGQHYFVGTIDDWARREYGQSVKNAYIDDTEETIFYKEMEKIENKISWLIGFTTIEPIQQARKTKFTVEFQHDPRGNTVKLHYEGDFIEL